MLKKQNRLTKKKDFERIFKQGRGFKENALFLKIVEKEAGPTKVGIIVSKKVSKKAVERNKVKRRIREIVRKIEFKQGFDIIIITHPSAKDLSFEEIKEQIINLFKKAKCLDL